MLHTAPVDEPHHGTVIFIEISQFAPSDALVDELRQGGADEAVFARRYAWELRQRSQRDRELFLGVLALAADSDCTLVDTWGEQRQAPRHILATILKQLATTQRDEARRRERLKRTPAAR